MKRLEIPKEEKDKGMIWVEYPITNVGIDLNHEYPFIKENITVEFNQVVELKIQQEKN